MKDFRDYLILKDPSEPSALPSGGGLDLRRFGGHIACKDGLWLSVQAASGNYCTPRSGWPDGVHPRDFYVSYEIALLGSDGFVNPADDDRYKDFDWAALWSSADDVVGWVPVEKIQALLDDIGLEHPFLHADVGAVVMIDGEWRAYSEAGKWMFSTTDEDEARLAMDQSWREAVEETETHLKKNGHPDPTDG